MIKRTAKGRQRGLLPKGEASAKGVSPMSDCHRKGHKVIRVSESSCISPDRYFAKNAILLLYLQVSIFAANLSFNQNLDKLMSNI